MMFAQTIVERAEVGREQARGGDLGGERAAPAMKTTTPRRRGRLEGQELAAASDA